MNVFDQLIEFAKRNHAGFKDVPDDFLRRFFETYKNTTLVNIVNGEIRGFGIYQEWPDLLNFICMVGNPGNNVFRNITAMLNVRDKIPDKKIVYFDESIMELKTICQQPQQVGQR